MIISSHRGFEVTVLVIGPGFFPPPGLQPRDDFEANWSGVVGFEKSLAFRVGFIDFGKGSFRGSQG